MEEPIEYRDGPEVDLGQLASLRRAAGWRDLAPEQLAAQLHGARWVASAWVGSRLVGFARAISDGVSNGYLSTVVVDGAFRKRGIGRALVERLVGGRDHIRWVLHARPEVTAFYEKLGFLPAPDMLWRGRRLGQ